MLKLLRENFGPGDKIVETDPFDRAVDSYLYSLAVVKPDGKRRILLVNKRDRPFDITVSGATGGQEDYVDQTTGFDPASIGETDQRENHPGWTRGGGGDASLTTVARRLAVSGRRPARTEQPAPPRRTSLLDLRRADMPRVAFRLRIKPDAIAGYEKDHAQVWPELLAKLKEVGISDYSIFRRDQDLSWSCE